MQVTSLEYGLFFLSSFVLSWSFVSHHMLRKLVLLMSSYGFIALIDPLFAGLVFATATTTYSCGFLIHSAPDALIKRVAGFFSIAAHIALFAVFKYFGFFMQSFAPLLAEMGLSRDMLWLEFALPIGISFILLQAISYLVDVYRGDTEAEKSFIDFHILLSFFPKIIAGPLVKSGAFLAQLKPQGSLTRAMVVTGVMLVVAGLVKKLIIADMLATSLVDQVFTDPARYSAIDVTMAVYALAIQLYCDISGYCDLALGTALLLGLHIKPNFDRPYSARSLKQFWQRWYISLTGFFKEYVFRPMGGAQGGPLETGRNVMLTFLIAGWWHGAGLSFTAFALYHAFFLMAEYALKKLKPAHSAVGVSAGSGGFAQLIETSEKGHKFLGPIFSVLLTFHIVCIGWLIFVSPDVSHVAEIFSAIAGGDLTLELTTPYIMALMLLAMAAHFLPAGFWERLSDHLCRTHMMVLCVFFALSILVLLVLASPEVKPFYYSAF